MPVTFSVRGPVTLPVSSFLWDPANAGTNALFANGNRDFTGATTGSNSARTTLGKSTGKWYCEMTVSVFLTGASTGVGFGKADFNVNDLLGNTVTSAGHAYSNGSNIVSAGITEANTIGAPAEPVLNDVIQLAMDVDAGKAWYGKNNTWVVGSPAAGTTPWLTWTPAGTWYFCGEQYAANPSALRLAATGTFTPPAGFTLINA